MRNWDSADPANLLKRLHFQYKTRIKRLDSELYCWTFWKWNWQLLRFEQILFIVNSFEIVLRSSSREDASQYPALCTAYVD